MAGVSITLAGNFQKLDELKNKAGKTATSIKAAFSSNAGKAMFAGIAAGAKRAVSAASDLGEVISKTQAVFKSSAADVIAWAESASRGFGQSKAQALDAASSFGNLFVAMGIGEQSAADMSRKMVELASDLASFNNTTVADSIAAIGAGLRGEAEPMRRFGVLMDDATLKAQALASGISNGRDALTPAEKALSAYNLILAKTTTAQGDFKKTSDGLANSQRTLSALTADMTAEIGKGLLPAVQEIVKDMKDADFQAIGAGIGDMAKGAIELGSALAEVVKWIPQVMVLEKLASIAGRMSKGDGYALPSPDFIINGDGSVTDTSPAATAGPEGVGNPRTNEPEKEKQDFARLIEASKEKAKTEAEAAAAKEKSRAAAAEEYRLEKDIRGAKISGDSDRLQRLEREKAIREEMKRLESAGYTAAEARKPAEQMVDADKQAESAVNERQRIADTLAGRRDDLRSQLDGLSFQSSIGAVSSMQRIGGGGGAVGSGLDYARQSNDLMRQMNATLLEIAANGRGNPLDN